MLMMNSVLTVEERMLLQALGCKDKAQAIAVLDEIKMTVPVRSDMFICCISLAEKMKTDKVDYAYEMTTVELSNENGV